MPDSKLDLLLDSIVSVLHVLATMPSSPEVRELVDRSMECERKVKAWDQQPPTPDEREAMMRKVLGLHASLSRLQRAP